MTRNHLHKHTVVLKERGLHSGRFRDAGETVELYGDDADRLESQGKAEAKKPRQKPRSEDG